MCSIFISRYALILCFQNKYSFDMSVMKKMNKSQNYQQRQKSQLFALIITNMKNTENDQQKNIISQSKGTLVLPTLNILSQIIDHIQTERVKKQFFQALSTDFIQSSQTKETNKQFKEIKLRLNLLLNQKTINKKQCQELQSLFFKEDFFTIKKKIKNIGLNFIKMNKNCDKKWNQKQQFFKITNSHLIQAQKKPISMIKKKNQIKIQQIQSQILQNAQKNFCHEAEKKSFSFHELNCLQNKFNNQMNDKKTHDFFNSQSTKEEKYVLQMFQNNKNIKNNKQDPIPLTRLFSQNNFNHTFQQFQSVISNEQMISQENFFNQFANKIEEKDLSVSQESSIFIRSLQKVKNQAVQNNNDHTLRLLSFQKIQQFLNRSHYKHQPSLKLSIKQYFQLIKKIYNDFGLFFRKEQINIDFNNNRLNAQSVVINFNIVWSFKQGLYFGQKKNNMKHGYGIQLLTNKNLYVGEFQIDQKSGLGKIKSNTFEYTGKWKKDNIEGKGILINQMGKFQGYFKFSDLETPGKIKEQSNILALKKLYEKVQNKTASLKKIKSKNSNSKKNKVSNKELEKIRTKNQQKIKETERKKDSVKKYSNDINHLKRINSVNNLNKQLCNRKVNKNVIVSPMHKQKSKSPNIV